MILDNWETQSAHIVAQQIMDTANQTENTANLSGITETFGENTEAFSEEFSEGVNGYTVAVSEDGKNVTVMKDGTEMFKGSVENFESDCKNFGVILTDVIKAFCEQLTKVLSRQEKTGYVTYATRTDGSVKTVYINGDNKTVTAGLTKGDIVHTTGGDYEIQGGSAGNYEGKPIAKASGTLSSDAGLHNIDEIGKELIIPSGRLRMMEYGDQIVPHNLSENILKWGALNPAILRSLSPEHTNNITNNKEVKVNIENVNLDNVTNGENFMPELNRYLQRTNTLL